MMGFYFQCKSTLHYYTTIRTGIFQFVNDADFIHLVIFFMFSAEKNFPLIWDVGGVFPPITNTHLNGRCTEGSLSIWFSWNWENRVQIVVRLLIHYIWLCLPQLHFRVCKWRGPDGIYLRNRGWRTMFGNYWNISSHWKKSCAHHSSCFQTTEINPDLFSEEK